MTDFLQWCPLFVRLTNSFDLYALFGTEQVLF